MCYNMSVWVGHTLDVGLKINIVLCKMCVSVLVCTVPRKCVGLWACLHCVRLVSSSVGVCVTGGIMKPLGAE